MRSDGSKEKHDKNKLTEGKPLSIEVNVLSTLVHLLHLLVHLLLSTPSFVTLTVCYPILDFTFWTKFRYGILDNF